MPAKGTIYGTHRLTFCAGGAQEDYDFHVRLLGLKSVKKTVLFDGEIPIYHLYYDNRAGDASTACMHPAALGEPARRDRLAQADPHRRASRGWHWRGGRAAPARSD